MFEKADIEQSIPDRFEQQAIRYADRLAVKTRSRELSYQELNAFANRIAHRILARCGGEAEPVALLLEQDAALIAAILGVLKAGKIYVPLDPGYPRATLAHMVRHSEARLIVADGNNLGLASELAGEAAETLSVDGIETGPPVDNPGISITPDHVAYIFYTSGSTGEPKGVADNHRNVLHNIMRYTNGLAICHEDRLTLLQSASFSGSVSSLFSAVLNGAAVFPFDLKRESLAALAVWMIQERITMYHSVPILFRGVAPEGEFFPDVRVIRLEGDQASPADVVLYRKHFGPDCVLVNGLGATETGITRRYFVDRNTEITGGILPIGYAVEDMDVLLLGEDGEPVECGHVGEIAVKSRYSALGYWRNPELTNARFRHCEGEDGLRIFLTGDLGRMRADGCLEHLGRRDFQVKIRGQRVDSVEVESALCRLEDVKAAAVAAFDSAQGEKRLAAYLVPTGERVPPASALRSFLAEFLPGYMIPSVFIAVDSLPLNRHGKLDRASLPPPDSALLERPDFTPPRTPMEESLAMIWREVLGMDQVGIHDNFFDLGGHSLTAMQVLARIQRDCRVELPVRALFATPTITELALVIAQKQAEDKPGV